MIKTFLSRAAVSIVACLSLFMVSCVQEEYKISEETLNLEVTVFQEGVSLPLGSTDSIKISKVIEQYADDEIKAMFPVGEDGSYAFGMSDHFDFSAELDFLSENFSIDGFSTVKNIPFDLSSVDVSSVKVDEIKVEVNENLSNQIESVDFTIDPITPDPIRPETKISDLLPDQEQLDIPIDDQGHSGVVASYNDVDIPFENATFAGAMDLAGIDADDEYDLDVVVDFLETASELPLGANLDLALDKKNDFALDEPLTVPVEIVLPAGINGVKDIHLHEGAQVTITVDLDGDMFFTSGEIVPHVDMDIHEIFHLTDAENNKHPMLTDHIIADFHLSKDAVEPGNPGNTYFVSNTYDIQSLVFERDADGFIKMDENADGNLVLKEEIEVPVGLTLNYNDLKTSLRHLDEMTGGNITMSIKVEFNNFEIDDVSVTVDPVEVPISTSIPLDIEEKLPDMITGINDVTFTEDSGVDITISVANLEEIENLDLNLGDLIMTFPEGIEVEGADENNVLVKHIGSLQDGETKVPVKITGLDLNAEQKADGYYVSLKGEVKVEGTASAGVKAGEVLHTKDLPKTAAEDLSLEVRTVATFDIEDFKVDFEGYYYEVNESEVIEFEVGKEVADLGEVVIYPETADGNEAVITIDIELPETDLPIGPSEEGLTIDFPDMLVFKELAAGLELQEGNVLVLKGELPSRIELPIDYIVAEAEEVAKEGTEEKVYMIRDAFTVTGKVGVAAGIVSKGDVDALTSSDAKVAFSAYVPEMVPSSVSINSYQAVVEGDPISFGEQIDLSMLPDELVSVGEILLNDVYLNINVKAPGIDELITDADVRLNMTVSLPDAIMLPEGVADADNVLHVEGYLENEEIVVEPIQVLGLSLNKTSEELADYMKDITITYEGNVTVSDATIDVDGLENTLNLDVDVNLATSGSEKIEIAKVTGSVNYQVDPIREEIDLSSLTGALNNENLSATLDLNRFSLALELNTNLSVPLIADLAIIPYKADEVMEGKTLRKKLEISIPEASAEPSLVRFWISNFAEGEDPYMPEGYEHIQLDLISLISLSPDKLVLELNAGTDPEGICSIAPSDEGYVLTADYAFNLPFEFGEDMKLEFRYVVPELPAELVTILQYGSLALTGEIYSSLPLELDMTYNFLDSAGNVIELAENAGHQTIQPGTISGKAVKTDLNIVVGIKKDADVTALSSLELVFKAKSVAGALVKEDTFVKATLQALIPEGVTLDLSQFLKSEEK